MCTRCKLRAALGGALALAVLGCPTRPPAPPPSAPAAATPAEPPHLGRPYDLVAAESLLTVRVYRAGALARAGHNHVIASHELAGTVYVSPEIERTSCHLAVPVDSLTVDEPELRAREASEEEFPREVPQSAREATRRNMLSDAVLDALHHPAVEVRCLRISLPQAGRASAALEIRVRARSSLVTVPLGYALKAGELSLEGELALKQSELGLTPFSALLGALQVQDEMRISFRIVARAAATSSR